MYYKGVNRGLSFTKPGGYSVGYVLIVGLLAIASGINGLFLFLSLGLGVLIVSGLLSEQSMRRAKIAQIEPVTATANQPFSMGFQVRNESESSFLCGLSVYLFQTQPRISLIGGQKNAVAWEHCRKIPPGQSISCSVTIPSLPRGRVKQIYVSHNTTFPFGLLEKFKYTLADCSIAVVPELDKTLEEELVAEIKSRFSIFGLDREFYCHRPYTIRDSSSLIDWKKSANRPSKQWVSKEYRSQENVNRVGIPLNWELMKALASEQDYERFASRIWTAFVVLARTEVPVAVGISDDRFLWDGSSICNLLADLPTFAHREAGLPAVNDEDSTARPGWLLNLELESWSWSRATTMLKRG